MDTARGVASHNDAAVWNHSNGSHRRIECKQALDLPALQIPLEVLARLLLPYEIGAISPDDGPLSPDDGVAPQTAAQNPGTTAHLRGQCSISPDGGAKSPDDGVAPRMTRHLPRRRPIVSEQWRNLDSKRNLASWGSNFKPLSPSS